MRLVGFAPRIAQVVCNGSPIGARSIWPIIASLFRGYFNCFAYVDSKLSFREYQNQ